MLTKKPINASVSTRVRPDRCAYKQVFLACITVEQCLKGRQESHEQRDPFLPAQCFEGFREALREHERLHASKTLKRRTRSVGNSSTGRFPPSCCFQ